MRRPELRVIVAADSALLRAGLARLLEDHAMEVVAYAGDAAELARKVRAYRPGLGIVALGDRPLRDDGLPVLILAQQVDHATAVSLLEAGAAGVGYLLE